MHFWAASLGAAAAWPPRARDAAAQQAGADLAAKPTPRDWSGGAPLRYPDPDLVALDPRFQRYILFNTPIQRLHTGSLWAEGPAWNGVGRYLVWSDIPNDRQLRYVDDDARVTTFRNPSGNSNGNTFDFQGRQLSCEHGGRRVARYEPTAASRRSRSKFDGKRLNSPNDVVVHPDGGIWFTDPPYGIRGDYEGNRAESETKEAVYRVDPQSGRVALVSDEVGATERPLLLARLHEALRRGHGRAARDQGLGRRGRGAAQRPALRAARHSGRGHADGRRRHPLRRRRQPLGRRAARRAGDRARRPADRDDPAARGVRERLLRRRASATACS